MVEKLQGLLDALNKLEVVGVDNAILLGYAGALVKQMMQEASQED